MPMQRLSPTYSKNEKDNSVSIRYVVRAGQKVRINDVIISGNHSTKDRIIRRDIFLAPGDIFNLTDLKDSKKALGRRGYFEKIDIKPERVDNENINLIVNVKETPTGSIQ